MKRKILVTGAGGFIGTALVTCLAQKPGVTVLGIGRRSKSSKDLRYHQLDLLNKEKLKVPAILLSLILKSTRRFSVKSYLFTPFLEAKCFNANRLLTCGLPKVSINYFCLKLESVFDNYKRIKNFAARLQSHY